MRQGLLAGLALAAILVMPGGRVSAAEDWSTLADGTKTAIVVSSDSSADTDELTMDANGTLMASPISANQATTLTIGDGGTFNASTNTLTVSDGGVLTFEDGSTFTQGSGGIISNAGGTTILTIGENGITGLDKLLDGTSGIDLQAGVLNVNFEADVDEPETFSMGAATGGTVNINIQADKTVGDAANTKYLAVDVGKADLNINNNGAADFNTVAAGNVTIKGVNSFAGAVAASDTTTGPITSLPISGGGKIDIQSGTNDFAAVTASRIHTTGNIGITDDDISITGGDINIQSGTNTFTGNVTASHTHTAGDITLTGDGDISINGGNIDIQNGTNTFTGNVAAGYTHTVGDITISGTGDIAITGGNINIHSGTNDFQGTLTAAYTHAGTFSVDSDTSYTPTVLGGNINIQGGTNTFKGNLTAEAIAFTGGQNTFDGSITLTANSEITFGAAAFLADSASLSAPRTSSSMRL
jgi:hypothetical protein